MARESSNEGKQSSAKPKKEKEKDSNSTVSGSNLKKEKDNNKLRETTSEFPFEIIVFDHPVLITAFMYFN
jgi:hypothetical protein